ncbi:MAG: hypothetical protein ABI742_04810 [Gemmatimonadota bacterium]
MSPKTLVRLTLLFLAAGAAWLSQQGRAASVQMPVPEAGAPAQVAPGKVTRAEIGFRDRNHLAEHYQKHGAEFGRVSMEEYLRAAQTLRDRPAGGDILESVRSDGVVTRFDRAGGAFLAFDRDGVIHTFFRPNDGEAYFQRQLRRGSTAP